MDRSVLALAAGAAMTVGAQGAFISFASDTNPAAPTFASTHLAGVTTIENFAGAEVDLEVDADEDGPGGPITLDAAFTASMELAFAGSVQIVPGLFAHNFSLAGFFEFTDTGSGDSLLRGDILSSAVLTAIGSATHIFSASISGFDVDYTVGSAASGAFGFSGAFPGDFGFTLTNLNGFAGAALVFEGQSIEGISNFTSEGSFSGSLVPTPGASALMAMAAFAGLRRRR